MSKRRVREKKENKQWSPVDIQHYYKVNAEYLMGYHLGKMEFWAEVKEYTRKTVKLNNANKTWERHSNMNAFAWKNDRKNKQVAS